MQTCPNCPPNTPTRVVFELGPTIRVLTCRGCGIQFAEDYPEMEAADSDIYGHRYFAEAIEQRAGRKPIFEELMAEIESVAGRGKGRLLDVGSGDGLLLEVAIVHGWRAEGLDISTAAVKYARDERGLTIHQGLIEDVPLEPGAYDVIVLNHVLEHVRNPRETLAHIRTLLAPNGVIRIEVPNVGSLSALTQSLQSRLKVKKNLWRHYETGHHFWFFTRRTLLRTLRGAGLEPVKSWAAAEQWGDRSLFVKSLNFLYKLTYWGGHLVAYVCPNNR
jgi:2-polyprenyl-3-methyl-5-hydroxy-6-metoxy-1,4-benzoquinol methylase